MIDTPNQLSFNLEFNSKKQIQEKYFCLFWKYVKRGTYQKFIVDLSSKMTISEVDEINMLIRKVYIDFAKEKFPELGNIKIDSDNSTLIIENEFVLKKIEPNFNRLMVGNHGIYLEFNQQQFDFEFVKKHLQYFEYSRNNFKIYHQFETVNYADYRIGKWYIDLYNAFGFETPDYTILIKN